MEEEEIRPEKVSGTFSRSFHRAWLGMGEKVPDTFSGFQTSVPFHVIPWPILAFDLCCTQFSACFRGFIASQS
jgi:hypothetical protein